MPKTLADGSIAYNLIRFDFEINPETTEAEINNLRNMGAQVLSQTDFDDYLLYGVVR